LVGRFSAWKRCKRGSHVPVRDQRPRARPDRTNWSGFAVDAVCWWLKVSTITVAEVLAGPLAWGDAQRAFFDTKVGLDTALHSHMTQVGVRSAAR